MLRRERTSSRVRLFHLFVTVESTRTVFDSARTGHVECSSRMELVACLLSYTHYGAP